jgi:hypothetical protein
VVGDPGRTKGEKGGRAGEADGARVAAGEADGERVAGELGVPWVGVAGELGASWSSAAITPRSTRSAYVPCALMVPTPAPSPFGLGTRRLASAVEASAAFS